MGRPWGLVATTATASKQPVSPTTETSSFPGGGISPPPSSTPRSRGTSGRLVALLCTVFPSGHLRLPRPGRPLSASLRATERLPRLSGGCQRGSLSLCPFVSLSLSLPSALLIFRPGVLTARVDPRGFEVLWVYGAAGFSLFFSSFSPGSFLGFPPCGTPPCL